MWVCYRHLGPPKNPRLESHREQVHKGPPSSSTQHTSARQNKLRCQDPLNSTALYPKTSSYYLTSRLERLRTLTARSKTEAAGITYICTADCPFARCEVMFIRSDKYLILKGVIEGNMCSNDMCDTNGEKETCENLKALVLKPKKMKQEPENTDSSATSGLKSTNRGKTFYHSDIYFSHDMVLLQSEPLSRNGRGFEGIDAQNLQIHASGQSRRQV
ncbi:uncharacterized protein V6R79_004355 [Siganus canaliculatus]